jgi:type IV pilus assembly protein PilQ
MKIPLYHRARAARATRLSFLSIFASLIFVAMTSGCSSAKKSEPGDSAEDQITEGMDAKQDAPKEGLNDLAAEELGASQPPPDLSISQSVAPPSGEGSSPAAPEPDTTFKGNYSEVSISDIRYVARKGGGTVVVETSSPATYQVREVPTQSQVVLELANGLLPERLKRPYITKDFGQPITSVIAYQDKGASTVRVVVQFKTPMHAEVSQIGRELMLKAAEPVAEIDENPTLGADAPATATGQYQDSGRVTAAGEGTDKDPRILPDLPADRISSENMRFYGKPISIEVRDTPVRDVISLIAEQSGANILVAGETPGNVTMKLRQVPWDQALLILLRSRNLGYVRQGSILRVAPFEALKGEADAAKAVADARKNAEPLRVRIVPVGYAKVADLTTQITPFLTAGRGKVVGDPRTNSLVITDTPDVLERVANLIKVLDLPPLQVLIEGKVVEAREAFQRNIGVNWNFSGNEVSFGTIGLNNNSYFQGLTIPRGGATYNIGVGTFDVFGNINATLGLAESQDEVKIISSPRIVAVNNETASILQGTNIPIRSVTQANGVTTTSVSYKEIEMKLEVTPQVTSENDVIMQINLKRDFATMIGQATEPNINRREAKTKVLVRNGQTAVIGGVYQSDMDNNEQGVPWFKNIPVLGWLFKNRTIDDNKSELLVFLTPRILNAETSIQKENSL